MDIVFFKVKLMMNLPKNFEKFAQESLCIKENDKSHSFPPLPLHLNDGKKCCVKVSLELLPWRDLETTHSQFYCITLYMSLILVTLMLSGYTLYAYKSHFNES